MWGMLKKIKKNYLIINIYSHTKLLFDGIGAKKINLFFKSFYFASNISSHKSISTMLCL